MKERLGTLARYLFLATAIGMVGACSSNDSEPADPVEEEYIPTPLPLTVPPILAKLLPPPTIPADNPQTVEGVALGKKLFFDPILSGDGTQACATCHQPQNSFSDTVDLSLGIDGITGNRNAMPLFNLAWNNNENFFWDGHASSLEKQAAEPVITTFEMHNTWEKAISDLQNHPEYPTMFLQAFGTKNISQDLATKAIAQFERTLISANSKFDKFLLGEATLTPSEESGFEIFMNESKGDCFHCHGNEFSPLWTDNIFHNNGLDETFADKGLGRFTGDPRDDGLFKSPSLRNLAYTAPYMHDGRFETLDEVINHYSEGLVYSNTLDPLMKTIAQGGVQLSNQQKADLKAFLLSLSDPSFNTNSAFQKPN